MNEMSGFIKLHKSFKNWEWYTDGNVARVYLHLLLSANYTEDTWKGVTLHPGQLITSIQRLSETLAISVQQVRTALNKLQKTGYITVEATNKYSLITLNHWEIYQEDNVSTTYRATVRRASSTHAVQQQIKNYKNNITKEVYKKREAYTQSESTTPKYDSGKVNYDYEAIRRLSRERIRQNIGKTPKAV